MFEWLEIEMAAVKTRKFFVVDGPATKDMCTIVERAVHIPPSYRAFARRFGNAQLYRKGTVYLVRVFAAPRKVELRPGDYFLHFGRTDLALAYFKETLLAAEHETPVFEWRHRQGIRQVAGGFEEWLRKRCRTAKRRFKAQEWKQILDGPPPFSRREMEIAEARKSFQWRQIGIAENGDVLIEVTNRSRSILPYLSIGVRGATVDFEGGVAVPVSSILPGKSGVVSVDCYKEQLPPSEVVLFQKAEPGPEDREVYWEFRQTVRVSRVDHNNRARAEN